MTKTSIPKLHSIQWKDGTLAPSIHHIGPRVAGDVSIEDVLREAWQVGYKSIAIVGELHDGDEYIICSSGDRRINAYLFSVGHRSCTGY